MKKCEHIKTLKPTNINIPKILPKIRENQLHSDQSPNTTINQKLFNVIDSDSLSLSIRNNVIIIECSQCNKEIPAEKTSLNEVLTKINNKKKVLGCTGLSNLGNTCYINSTIQVLSNIKCIKKYFLQYIYPKSTSGLLKEFCVLIKDLWMGFSYIKPVNFVSQLDFDISPTISRYRHQDALEFFHFFHDAIEKQLSTEFDSSFFTQIFTWKIEHTIQCCRCNTTSTSYESLLELPLCIPELKTSGAIRLKSSGYFTDKDRKELSNASNTLWKKFKILVQSKTSKIFSLYDCLVLYFENEELFDPNSLRFCETCKSKEKSVRSQKILEAPSVLLITFKRYHTFKSKNSVHIQLPLELNISGFSVSNSFSGYRLTGIIAHSGSLSSGHYVAYCKNYYNGNWYKFDDKSVTARTEEEVLSKQAYIAVYTEIRTKNQIRQGLHYVPNEWCIMHKILNCPGAIPYNKFLCKHGNIAFGHSIEEFNRVSYTCVKNYCVSPVVDLRECEVCAEECMKKKVYFDKEKDVFEKLKKDSGEYNYVVSANWIKKWGHHVLNEDSYPGRIINLDVVEEREKVYINYKTWSGLAYLYGADFEVKCDNLIFNKDVFNISQLDQEVINLLADIKIYKDTIFNDQQG